MPHFYIELKNQFNYQMSVNYHGHSNHEQCQKKLQKCEHQYKNQIALLNQNIEFLKQELKEHEAKQEANKRINQSIMLTYQQNQNYRSQYSNKEIKRLKNTHETEIKRLKEIHHREMKRLEQDLTEEKRRNEEMMIELDRKGFELEKKILSVRQEYQEQLQNYKEEMQKQLQSKQEIMKEKIRQASQLIEIQQFKEANRNKREIMAEEELYLLEDPGNLSKNKEGLTLSKSRPDFRKSIGYNGQSQTVHQKNSVLNAFRERSTCRGQREKSVKMRSSSEHRKSRVRQIEQSNNYCQQMTKASRESVKLLAQRIDRASTFLKSSSNLHKKVSKRLEER